MKFEVLAYVYLHICQGYVPEMTSNKALDCGKYMEPFIYSLRYHLHSSLHIDFSGGCIGARKIKDATFHVMPPVQAMNGDVWHVRHRCITGKV